MVLGSGPIKIGQAAEFDFSGSQAVRALREDGYKVILVNSNPATIQNDPEMADIVYIEPLLPTTIAKILEKERPCALLAGMGGQTALNIASELSHNGTLERLGVELIGSDLDAIDKAEDRELFNKVCESINLSPSAKPWLAIPSTRSLRPPNSSAVGPSSSDPLSRWAVWAVVQLETWANWLKSLNSGCVIHASRRCSLRNPFWAGRNSNTK